MSESAAPECHGGDKGKLEEPSQENLSISGKLHEAPRRIALALSRVESKPLPLGQASGTPASTLPLDGLFVCF